MILIIKDHLACNTIGSIKEQVYIVIHRSHQISVIAALYYIAYKLKKFYTSRSKSVEIQ
jgi:hypothetical protein